MLRGKAIIKTDCQVAGFREALRQPPMGCGTARDPCAAVQKKQDRMRACSARDRHVGRKTVAKPHLLVVVADARDAGHDRFVPLREGLDLRPNRLDTCRRRRHERFEIAQKLLLLSGHGVLLDLSSVRVVPNVFEDYSRSVRFTTGLAIGRSRHASACDGVPLASK
jgi:hypothetical protein